MNQNKERAQKTLFLLEGISSCAVHPKFMDEEIVREAQVTDAYLRFSDALHHYTEAVSEIHASHPRSLTRNLLQEMWGDQVAELLSGEPYERLAAAYKDRLIEHLGS